jgi:hypothetical protein
MTRPIPTEMRSGREPNYCIHQPGRAASGPNGSEPERPARPAGDACVRGTPTKTTPLAAKQIRLAAGFACILALWSSLGDSAQARVIIGGVLERAMPDSCVVLSTLHGYVLLDNIGEFAVGDSVVVVADDWGAASCGDYGVLYLRNNSIDPLNDCDLGCGLLALDTEYFCPIFYTDRFGAILLDSYAEFASGDSVHVVGDFEIRACITMSECTPDYCLERNTTAACTLTPVPPSTWGRLKRLFR